MKSVFVVDDDPDQAEIMGQLLASRTRNVRTFSDPVRAMAALAEGQADLLIADLSLPWVDGTDVIKAAQLKHPALVIFLVSGYPRGPQIAQECGLRFFSKPVNYEELRACVDQALSG